MTRKRVRRGEAEWRRLLGELEGSGKTVRAFAGERGLALSSIQRWQSRLSKPSAAPKGVEGKAVFSEVVVVPRKTAASSRIEVVTRGGRSIRIEGALDASLLREVLRVVESC